MNAQILLWILTITFLSYVIGIWAKFGVQKSISDSAYRLKGAWKSLFTFFCWGIGFPLAMIANGDTLLFFSGAAFLFVGATFNFNDTKMAHRVHMIAAYTGIIFAQLGLWIYYGWWYSLAAMALSIIPLYFVKNKIWWIEIAAFLTAGASLWMLLG